MGDSDNSASPKLMETAVQDCEAPRKLKEMENFGNQTKRKLWEVKHEQMTGDLQAVARYRFAVIFGFTSVLLSLIFIGSIVYLSLQTDLVHTSPDRSSPDYNLELELAELLQRLPNVVSDNIDTDFIDNMIVSDPKYRSRRSTVNKQNEIESEDRGAEKRQTELINQRLICKTRFEACQSILNKMNTLTSTANDDLNSLKNLVSSMREPGGAFADLAQCVECRNLEPEKVVINNPPMQQASQSGGNNGLETVNRTKIVTKSNSTEIVDGMKVTKVIKNTTIYEEPINQKAVQRVVQEAKADEPVIYHFPIHGSDAFQDFPSGPSNEDRTKDIHGMLGAQGPSFVNFDSRSMQTQYQPGQKYEMNPPVIPTAETVKTGQQVQINSPMACSNVPLYFRPVVNQNPQGFSQPSAFPYLSAPGQYHMQNPPRVSVPPAQGFSQFQSQAIQNGPYGTFHINSAGSYPQTGMPPTGPDRTFQGSGQPLQAYNCPYPSGLVHQFQAAPGISGFPRNSDGDRNDHENQILAVRNGGGDWNENYIHSGYQNQCKQDEYLCMDRRACVSKLEWCDGFVNCHDASDETRCPCPKRINRDKLCDGYIDCPHNEDELGCFGCPPGFFSCQDWDRRHRQENCIPMTQRCDGTSQCRNNRDEMECTMLIESMSDGRDTFLIGYLSGYLHKNYKGKWYPVCNPTQKWVIDACAAESGTIIKIQPKIQAKVFLQGIDYGPYLTIMPPNEEKVIRSCNNQALFVECPPIPCGTRVNSLDRYRHYGIYEDSLVASPSNATSGSIENYLTKFMKQFIETINSLNKGEKNTEKEKIQELNQTLNAFIERTIRNETTQNPVNQERARIGGSKEITDGLSSNVRIVGGRSSWPQAWPFLVAIYRDGYFHCGAVILDVQWILTAAHCVDGHKTHYYEVQAGLLRRYSYSPMAQSRRAHFIIPHPEFNVVTMRHDIALIKLDKPLLFNRWVRPTCLPPSSWGSYPTPESTCVTIGWGSTTERGPDADELQEVEIPILNKCKHARDKHDGEICAGVSQGGKDACQGDSGGPLMCKVPGVEDQWYTAGVVSHGEGCGRQNEPGAYTRVSKYTDWIDHTKKKSIPQSNAQTTRCPGFVCDGGRGKCLPANRRCNGRVDCLHADDEMYCPNSSPYIAFQTRNAQPPLQHLNYFNNLNSNSSPKPSITEIYNNYFPQSQSIPPPTASPPQTPVRIETIQTTTTEPSTSSAPTTLPPPTPNLEIPDGPEHFRCSRMHQAIPVHKRCDEIIDCEDGTDEANCTCRDILFNNIPSALCDGHLDCHDRTDEKDCNFCRDDQFTCSRSGTCIPKTQACDTTAQCPLKEDESDCFTLSNNRYIVNDLENRTYLNREGVVTRISNGIWKPICSNYDEKAQAAIADNICFYLGLKGHELVKNVTVGDNPLMVQNSAPKNRIAYQHPLQVRSAINESNTCQGLYVKCQRVLTSSVESHRVEHVRNNPVNTTYLFPWDAAIFVNGHYHCPGVLLEDEWVLTSHRCTKDIDLRNNYTTVVAGLSPTFQYADGPHQQVVKVDSVRPVDPKHLEASLIHLENPLNMSRNVKPVFYDKLIFPSNEDDECVAVGTDEKFDSKKTFFKPVIEGCPNCHRCYVNATTERCRRNETHSWDGVVVCRGKGGWYPAAVFQDKDMLCGFKETQTLTSIDYVNAYITQAMEKQVESVEGPKCDGLRCNVGNCIPWRNICDGIQHCRDGEDEADARCKERRESCERSGGIGCTCAKSEFKCRSGECMEKEKFCDGVNDCRDGSDEPKKCSCGEYLKLTNPKLVCDNVRHCWDKTDETDQDCLCKDSSFQCWNITKTEGPCIPQDFVCDGFNDCENGADEKDCRIIKGHRDDADGVGQVLKRSSGVWHSECFPYPIESPQEAIKICRSMRYIDGAILSRQETNKYGNALVPSFDDFFMIKLNPKKSVHMRADKPLVSLVTAKEVCHRAFVRCSTAIPR